MTNQTDTPEITPVSSPPPEDKGKSQSIQQTVDWEARYNGLNRTFGNLQKKYDDLNATYQQLVAEMEELRQSTKKHETEKGTLSTSLEAIKAEKAELERKASLASFDKDRMALIINDFIDLAPFEALGLLPAASTLDELKPKLEKFRETMGKNVKEGVTQTLRGTGPAPSSKNDTPPGKHDIDYVYNRMLILTERHNRTPEEQAEWIQLQKEWDEFHAPK